MSTYCHNPIKNASVYLYNSGYKKTTPFWGRCQLLTDRSGLADSFESVASPFDGGNLFVKELETIKRATKILGTQNLPHN
jgi:hypothetical protein